MRNIVALSKITRRLATEIMEMHLYLTQPGLNPNTVSVSLELDAAGREAGVADPVVAQVVD